MQDSGPLRQGQIFAGDFTVVRLIARGGMGAVYEVEQRSSGHRRALKVLHPDVLQSGRNRELFVNEARVGARIGSDHVVQVIAAGIDAQSELPWMAMEYLEGEDLETLLRRRGALPPGEALALLEQVGDALAAAHARGIVHCDLKPQNLFVARSTLRGVPFVVKVLDFGIARAIAADHTSATVTRAIGSPMWMAPEQSETGARLRPATDVWALGLIAFRMLTGRPYWVAANATPFNLNALIVEVVAHALEPASARLARLGAGAPLPPGFDAWFARCVHRAIEQRYPDAGAAIDALRPVLLGTAAPSFAPPPAVGATVPMSSAPTPPPTPATADAWTVERDATRRSKLPVVAAAAGLALVGVVTVALYLRTPATPTGAAHAATEAGAPQVAAVTPPAPAPAPAAPLEAQRLDPAPQPAPPLPVAPPPATPEAPVRQTLESPRERQAREAREREAARTADRANGPNVPAAPAPAAPAAPAPDGNANMTPMERVAQCRSSSADETARNNCIINALRGRASTEQELRMLAATYQVAGRTQDAIRTMRTYIQRYPQGSAVRSFEQYILRNSAH
ncbi:MAG: serine/threonine-protein kinase [Polyangiales bacterium]